MNECNNCFELTSDQIVLHFKRLLLSAEADQSVVTSTPQRPFRDLLHRSHDRSHDTSRDHSFGNETISVQRRCGSLTRTGQRCKSFCKRGSTSCSRHDNSYNSYLEHSNVVN